MRDDYLLAILALILAVGATLVAAKPWRTPDIVTEDYRTSWTEADVREALKKCPTEAGWPVFLDDKMYCTDGHTTFEIPKRTPCSNTALDNPSSSCATISPAVSSPTP